MGTSFHTGTSKIRHLKENTSLDPVDGTLAYKPALAFPNLQWAGWDPINEAGKPQALRPIILTHAGDGSNRVFVATQRGVIHVFDNDQKATSTQVYADLSKKVSYSDRQNEEGFLGFAFHPKLQGKQVSFSLTIRPSNLRIRR